MRTFFFLTIPKVFQPNLIQVSMLASKQFQYSQKSLILLIYASPLDPLSVIFLNTGKLYSTALNIRSCIRYLHMVIAKKSFPHQKDILQNKQNILKPCITFAFATLPFSDHIRMVVDLNPNLPSSKNIILFFSLSSRLFINS